jgi:hypothetical protein
MTNILKEIVNNHGYVTSKQLVELARHNPDLPLVIKWAIAPRGVHPAREVVERIAKAEKLDAREYAREVFLSANQLDTIREVIK